MEETLELLRKLAESKFFGALVIKFEAGKIVLLKKEETLKPTHYGDNRRDEKSSK